MQMRWAVKVLINERVLVLIGWFEITLLTNNENLTIKILWFWFRPEFLSSVLDQNRFLSSVLGEN